MVDIDAAIGYVVARGDSVDRAHLSFLRTGAPPAEEIFEHVEMGQMPTGGWPAQWGGDVASIDATCFRLAELDGLAGVAGLGRTSAMRALDWLANRQRLDGFWEEDPALRKIRGWVEDSGEGRWTVQDAIDQSVPAWTMTAALFARFGVTQFGSLLVTFGLTVIIESLIQWIWTADYRKLVQAARDVVAGESLDLLESLAGEVARAVAGIPRVVRATAIVHKPAAARSSEVQGIAAAATAESGG